LIASTCVLADHAVDDMTPVVELAQRGAKAEPENPMMVSALGAALYRAGRIAEAVEVLEKALPLHNEPIRFEADRHDEFRVSQLSTTKFMVLAYRDAGETEKSIATLADLRRNIREIEQHGIPSSARSTVPWSFRLAVELARRELAMFASP